MKKLLIIIALVLSACMPLTAKAADDVSKDSAKKDNKVYILGGIGPGHDFTINSSNGIESVKTHQGILYGVGYEHRIEKSPAFVGGQFISNGTFMLSVGGEF